MPDLVEQMYCSQQIFIPPNLPSILKKYAKAAIRTQPGDLLAWSSAYFRALAEGIPPPAKDRIEYPPVDTPSGLSPGFLKVLINQIGKRETVHKDVLAERWKGVCLNPKALQDLLDVGAFEDDVSWLEFLAICVGTLEPSLTKTMIELCELLTDEPEGGRSAVPVSIFLNLYKYLAKMDCGPVNRLEDYEKALKADSETQCQATNLIPTEEEKESQEANINWDTAIGDESTPPAGEDPDEGIVVEAADVENDVNEQDGDQVEEANTNGPSPEQKDAKSEENVMANEESVEKIELLDDAQSSIVSEDVGSKDGEVSKESDGGTSSKDVNEREPIEENGEQQEELGEIKAEGNETTEGDSKEEDRADKQKAEDGVTEADNKENDGVSTDIAEEGIQENAVGDEKESPTEGDTDKVDDDVPTGDPIDEAADAASPGKDESGGADSVEADTTDANQLEEDTEVLDGANEGQDGIDKTETDAQAADDSEKDAVGAVGNEGEAKSDEVEVDEQNGEDTADVEPPKTAGDTKDENFDSATAEEIPVESTDLPGEGGADNDETEEDSATDLGLGAKTSADIGESAPNGNEESAEGVEDEVAATTDEPEQEEPSEAQNDELAKDDSGAEINFASATDEASQGQAEEEAPNVENKKEVELEVDRSKSQDENEDHTAAGTESQEESPIDANDHDATKESDKTDDTELDTDENKIEDIKSAIEAVSEASDTTEALTPEIKEPTAEDENGNENKPPQETIEETIDPKTAYIVNDDGTLSAPRAESVLDEDALKERDSDNSVFTKDSDDGMMVWPDIKPQEKDEAEPEPLLEKEVTSEDGIEVFTDIETQPHQEELKMVADQQEEEQVEAEEENIFAPQIDSFTDLLEVESAPIEETNPEQLAAALEFSEVEVAESGLVIPSGTIVTEVGDSGEEEGPAETAALPSAEDKAEEQEPKKEKKPRRQNKDVEIESLVKKDSDMMLLPTPITSDIMLYMDGTCGDKTTVKICPTQQLQQKLSMIDVQVSVPVDETIVEVVEQHHYPKWMHIPGIGPTVPDYIIEEAENYFLKIAELQEGMVMPRNIKHFHCPPLELTPDCPEGIADGI